MMPLVRKLLRDLRWPLLITIILLAGFQCLWVKISQRTVTQLAPFFSTLAARAGASQKAIEDVIFGGPGKVAQTVIGGESIHFERAMDTLSIGYVHPLMQFVFCIWAIGRAAGALAGELDRGTLELLLAQPIARRTVVLAHLAVDVLVIPVLCLSLWAGTLLGLQIVGPFQVTEAETSLFKHLPFAIKIDQSLLHVDRWAFGPATVNVAGLIFAVSGLTMALSACGRFRNRVIGIAAVILLVMFIINVIGQMWDAVATLRPFTVFYYYQPQAIALHGKWTVNLGAVWPWADQINMLVVLFAVGAVGYAIALTVFSRRDMPAPL